MCVRLRAARRGSRVMCAVCVCVCVSYVYVPTQEEMVSYLEQRAEAVESVLHYIETRSHDAHAALTFEEYQVCVYGVCVCVCVTHSSTLTHRQAVMAHTHA